MLFKIMAIINSSINGQVYIEILDDFNIPLLEIWFGDQNFLFQGDNASWHKAK